MISTTLDVLGLAALVAGVFVLAGLGLALVVLCPCMMFVAFTVSPEEDRRATLALALFAARARRAAGAPARAIKGRRHVTTEASR